MTDRESTMDPFGEARAGVAAGFGLLALALFLWACGTSGEVTSTVSVRDSAGVRIVENAPDESADSCRIPADPPLEIGARTGAPSEQLHRVMDAARLSDGRIAVVNQGSDEIRLYDSSGQFLHGFGREGQGPGEFRDVFQIWREAGDTLLVGDYRPWRFQRFTPDGAHLETVRPDPVYPNPPEVMGVLADGGYVLGRTCCRTEAPGFHERELTLFRHSRDGRLADTLGVYSYGKHGFLSLETRFMGGPLFEARTRASVGPERIAVGMGDRREIRLLAPDGTVNSLVRWTGPDRTVTEREVEVYRRETLAEYEGRPEMRERYAEPLVAEDRPVSDRFPAHATVLLGRDGAVWVRRYPRPSRPDDEGMRWLVFRPDGRFACHAVTPEAIENPWDLFEVGSEYLLAETTDELDVEYVRLYRWER